MKKGTKIGLGIGILIALIVLIIVIIPKSPTAKTVSSANTDAQTTSKIIQTPTQQNWTLTDFRIFGTRGFDLSIDEDGKYKLFDTIPENPQSSANINLALKQIWYTPPYQDLTWINCKIYDGALMTVTSDVSNAYYNRENVSCIIEEYYNGILNGKTTKNFGWTGIRSEKNNYGFSVGLSYEQNKNPSEAKYIITCTGEKSENVISKTFAFNINYLDNITVQSFICSEK